MTPTITVDPNEIRRIQEAMRLYQIATGKDFAEILNRFGRNVAIYSSAKMSKAKRNIIEGQLLDVIGHRLPRVRNGKKGRPTPITVPTTMARAILVKGFRKRGEPIPRSAHLATLARQMVRQRVRSIGYHKAGNIPALKEFGAPASKSGAKQFGPPRGKASKADAAKLSASLSNFARGINVQQAAWDQGIREARLDMEKFARSKLAETAKKTSQKINSK